MTKAKHHGLMSEYGLQQEGDPVLEVLCVVAKFLVSFIMHKGKFGDVRRNKSFPAKICLNNSNTLLHKTQNNKTITRQSYLISSTNSANLKFGN